MFDLEFEIVLRKMHEFNEEKQVCFYVVAFSHQNSMSKKAVVKLESKSHHWFTTGRKAETITIVVSNE